MNLKSVVLGFLMREKLTGYELKHLMDRSVGFFFGASYGSIYPALKDLEEAGLVSSELVVQEERPNKKVYEITPKGREHFRAQLAESKPSGDGFRSEFLMHLFFGDQHEPERLLEMVAGYRGWYEERLESLRGVEEEFGEIMSPYQRMCLNSGLSHFESRLRWIDGVEEELRSLSRKKRRKE